MRLHPADAGSHMTFSLDWVRRFFYAHSSTWNHAVGMTNYDV